MTGMKTWLRAGMLAPLWMLLAVPGAGLAQTASFTDCPGDINLGCNPPASAFPDSDTVLASASSTCGVVTAWVSRVTTTTGCFIVERRTHFAIDGCDDLAQCEVTVRWQVNPIPPDFGIGTNLHVGCDVASIPNPDAVLAGVSADCGVSTSWYVSVTGGTPCAMARTTTYYAVDLCGRTGTSTRVVTWSESDTGPPVFGFCPAELYLCDDGSATLPEASEVLDSVTDDCGVVNVWHEDVDEGTSGCERVVLRSYFASDFCGYTAVCTQRVRFVTDTAPPTYTCDTNAVDIGCHNRFPALPHPFVVTSTLTEDCGIARSWIEESLTNVGCRYTHTRDFYAVDHCGQTATCVQVATWILDTETPRFVDCTSGVVLVRIAGEIPDFLPTVEDDCAEIGAVQRTVEILGTNTYADVDEAHIFSWADCAGNAITCRVEYIHRLPPAVPVYECPPETYIGCNPSSVDFPDPQEVLDSARSGCAIVSNTVASFVTTNGCERRMTRTYDLIDECGQVTSCVHDVVWNVFDPPVIGCTETQIFLGCIDPFFGLDEDDVPSAVDLFNLPDECGIGNIVTTKTLTVDRGCTSFLYRTIETLDLCGGHAVCTQVFYWIDEEYPTLVGCPGFGEPEFIPVGATIPPPTDYEVVSPCSEATVSHSVFPSIYQEVVGDVTNVYNMILRFYEVSNACGNYTPCVERFVLYPSASGATISCAGLDVDFGCRAGPPTALELPFVGPILNTASSSCDIVRLEVIDEVITNGCARTMIRTYEVVDSCAFTASCSDVFHWREDGGPPTFASVPPDRAGCDIPVGPLSQAVAVDDSCGIATSFYTEVDRPGPCGRDIVRTWTAIDGCDRMVTATQVVSVIEDVFPPDIDCPQGWFVPPDAGGVYRVPDLTGAVTARDNCGIAGIAQSMPAGTPLGSGAFSAILTVTATDLCGLEATCDIVLTNAGMVGDLAWEDANTNGIRDAGEAPLAGVTVTLRDSLLNAIDTTVTDANGAYLFHVDPNANGPSVAGVFGIADSYLAVEFDAAGFVATVPGGDSAVLAGQYRTPVFRLRAGEIRLERDGGFVVDPVAPDPGPGPGPGPVPGATNGAIQGIVWEDLSGGSPDSVDLTELGLDNVRMRLFQSIGGGQVQVGDTLTASDTDRNRGNYGFGPLPPGDYLVQLDFATLPISLQIDGVETSRLVSVTAGLTNTLHFPVAPRPTAVGLESIEARHDQARWRTGFEAGTLGFAVVDLASGEWVGELVLANGGGSEYRADGLAPGDYALDEIRTDLTSARIAEFTVLPEVDAAPEGVPTLTLAAGPDGTLEFVTDGGYRTYLVTGVHPEAELVETGDNPVRLRAQGLMVDGEHALYFSWPGGRSLRVR